VALRFLVDTSVLKRLGGAQVREVVEPLAAAGQLGRASICDLEVGYSARTAEEWDGLVGALGAFDSVERSQRGRKIPDLLIAAAAEELHIAVLHYDSDFDLIAAVTGQRCAWVLPAGSVD
jgi:predicted nucleic acid-binding protein